jgi:Putative bacterial sensory transduction regulator
VGNHALGIHAFVCRRPDENHEQVYAWLLQRNLRLYGVSFAIDRLGDIYLDGRLPLSVVEDEDELDRLLGAVLTTADDSFNSILELGFASSIRKEWEWRNLRGESTKNLEAFRGWLEAGDAEG